MADYKSERHGEAEMEMTEIKKGRVIFCQQLAHEMRVHVWWVGMNYTQVSPFNISAAAVITHQYLH